MSRSRAYIGDVMSETVKNMVHVEASFDDSREVRVGAKGKAKNFVTLYNWILYRYLHGSRKVSGSFGCFAA